MIKLSFILPCYNVEKYIERCVSSIISIGIPKEEYEIICVDDCGQDGTRSLLVRLQRDHDNLRVISHAHNKGIGGARNTGIREAKGKYLWFVDSDDEICGEGVQNAIDRLISEDLDVLCFNYRRIDEKGTTISALRVFSDTEQRDGYSFVECTLNKGIIYHLGYVVRFIYRTCFIRENGLLFPENIIFGEDTVFMPRALFLANHVASVSDILYSYRINNNSVTETFAHSYPARLVYEISFPTGLALLDFAYEIKDKEYKELFIKTAKRVHLEGFALLLFRTRKLERKRFYKMITLNPEEINRVKQEVSLFYRILLLHPWGKLLTELCTVLYRIKHFRK